MKHLHPLIRETGEACRQLWDVLTEPFSDIDDVDFPQYIVHQAISHWEGPSGLDTLIRSLDIEKSTQLTIAEVVSLNEHGTLDPLPIRTIHEDVYADIMQRLGNIDHPFDKPSVVRWATVYFWDTPDGEYDLKATRALLHQPTEGLLELMDTAVLEGLCKTLGRPSDEMLETIERVGACEDEDNLGQGEVENNHSQDPPGVLH